MACNKKKVDAKKQTPAVDEKTAKTGTTPAPAKKAKN